MVSNIFHVSVLEMYSVPNYIHKLIHEITSTLYLYYERMKVFLTDICWKAYFKPIQGTI